jgi:hypothetical protein
MSLGIAQQQIAKFRLPLTLDQLTEIKRELTEFKAHPLQPLLRSQPILLQMRGVTLHHHTFIITPLLLTSQ